MYGKGMVITWKYRNLLRFTTESGSLPDNSSVSLLSIDIANDLGVSKPSVSVAMKNLRNGEYIEMDKEGYITLLDKGREIAEKIYERHTFLTDWLTSIGVDPTVAAEDACRIEHVISAETFTAMKKTLKTK